MGQKRPRPDLPPTASTCTVYSELLPPELLDSLKQQANTLADCPNFWVPLDRCRADHGKYAAERAVQLAYQQVLQRLYPGEHDIAGAEWWVQVYKPGAGLAFHFDKDEALFKQQSVMHHPKSSAVLYLYGDAEARSLGPTVIADQQYDNMQKQPLPDEPQKTTVVLPRANTMALFDGRLAHGVLESSSRQPRATLLINWWSYQPQDVQPPDPEQLSKLQGDWKQGAAEPSPKGLLQGRRAVHIVVEPAADIITMDDLIEGAAVCRGSTHAEQAVCVRHKHHRLFPLDMCSCNGTMDILAALVPQGMEL